MTFNLTLPSMNDPDWPTLVGNVRENQRAEVQGDDNVFVNTGNLILRARAQGTAHIAAMSLFSGNGTTSGRLAFLELMANETSPQQWFIGMVGTKDAQVMNQTRGTAPITVDANNDRVKFLASYYERNRSLPVGEWAHAAFSATNFTQDTGTWAVSSGNVVKHDYALVGTKLTLACSVQNTSVSGNPNALRVKTLGFTVAQQTDSVCAYKDNGTWELGHVRAVVGQQYVEIYKKGFTGTWQASSALTNVLFVIDLEVS